MFSKCFLLKKKLLKGRAKYSKKNKKNLFEKLQPYFPFMAIRMHTYNTPVQ